MDKLTMQNNYRTLNQNRWANKGGHNYANPFRSIGKSCESFKWKASNLDLGCPRSGHFGITSRTMPDEIWFLVHRYKTTFPTTYKKIRVNSAQFGIILPLLLEMMGFYDNNHVIVRHMIVLSQNRLHHWIPRDRFSLFSHKSSCFTDLRFPSVVGVFL